MLTDNSQFDLRLYKTDHALHVKEPADRCEHIQHGHASRSACRHCSLALPCMHLYMETNGNKLTLCNINVIVCVAHRHHGTHGVPFVWFSSCTSETKHCNLMSRGIHFHFIAGGLTVATCSQKAVHQCTRAQTTQVMLRKLQSHITTVQLSAKCLQHVYSLTAQCYVCEAPPTHNAACMSWQLSCM